MAYEALRHYSLRSLSFRFVSNVDATDFVEAVRDLDPGRNALHRRVEDVHDAGDDDQRPCRARLAPRGAGGRRDGRGAAFRRGVDQRGEGDRIRDRRREHVRLLGLGRRPLFDGLGDRPVDDARDRSGPLSRDARRLPRDGRAFPGNAVRAQPAGADGAPRALEQQFPRRGNGRRAALRTVPQALPGLSAAADDGEQRQARDAGRRAGRLRHGPDLLGRARHQRPAFVLPVDPPGDAPHPLRFHRVRQVVESAGTAPRHAARERVRAGRGARVRQDGGGGEGRGHGGSARPASRVRGQPSVLDDPRRRADARRARHARRPLRAQRVHAGRDLGHRSVRPVGRGARQGAGATDRRRAHARKRCLRSATTAPPTR